MEANLFEYEMKKKGYRTASSRAFALGLSLSSYYRRLSNAVECSKDEIETTASILGWDIAKRIFFGNEVS